LEPLVSGGYRFAIEAARPLLHEAGKYDALIDEIKALVLSKHVDYKHAGRSNYPFVGDVVGNTICADLLDYLQRDHKNSGKLLDMWMDALWLDQAVEVLPELGDHPDRLNASTVRSAYEQLQRRRQDNGRTYPTATRLGDNTTNRVEALMRTWCDCGLLVHIHQVASQRNGFENDNADERWLGIAELASGVTYRRLYDRQGDIDRPVGDMAVGADLDHDRIQIGGSDRPDPTAGTARPAARG